MLLLAFIVWSLVAVMAIAFILSQRHIKRVIEPQLAAYHATRAVARADFAARGIDYDRAMADVDAMLARRMGA